MNSSPHNTDSPSDTASWPGWSGSAKPRLWDVKPWWCQPWSIVLTGVVIPTAAWILLHRLWIVIPLGVLVGGWWFLFLYLVPRAYAEQAMPKP